MIVKGVCEIIKAACLTLYVTVVTCSKLSRPANGEVFWESTEFNSIASYSCDEGYVLNGASERVCLANGFWSDRQPLCSEYSPQKHTPSAPDRLSPSPSTGNNLPPLTLSMDYPPHTTLTTTPLTSDTPTSAHPQQNNNTNIYIVWGMIILMLVLIVVVVLLIIVVYHKRRKMSALAASTANSVENPLYSGGHIH